jgi:alpha-ketoglutarate-dependent taurine dioxygenase
MNYKVHENMASLKIANEADITYLDFKKFDSYNSLADQVRNLLTTEGYVVVRNFNASNEDITGAGVKFLEICSLVGNPISHNTENAIIWDIKSNPESTSQIKTYSEHTHEAQMHTDSQYSSYPEDYFALLTLTKANCGGGASNLLSLKNILSELKGLENGAEVEAVLRNSKFPFIIPNVFKRDNNNSEEFNFGSILQDNEIRFRVDTFEKAIAKRPDLCAEEQIAAYKILKQIILNSESTQNFYLEPQDVIFINNKTMLHGRTLFTDLDRHLLRIRMNKFNAIID